MPVYKTQLCLVVAQGHHNNVLHFAFKTIFTYFRPKDPIAPHLIRPFVRAAPIAESESLYDELSVTLTRQAARTKGDSVEQHYDMEKCGKRKYKPIPMWQQFGILATRGFLNNMR